MLKSSVFWDINLRSPMKLNGRFKELPPFKFGFEINGDK
jgi:hypothetical protein